MKQVASDKYNVAWFKLADCIARGEKERALGIYRLLSHSLDDPALMCQLQADILLSFKDKKAREKYEEAALLYRERNRLLESAAVYEHLVTLEPDVIVYRINLVDLYQQLRILSKVVHYVRSLVEYLLAHDEWKRAIEILEQYDMAGDLAFAAQLHELVLWYLVEKNLAHDSAIVHVKKVLDVWTELDNQQEIERILARLDSEHKQLALRAREYMAA